MSQHILASTRKKLTAVAVTLALAASPLVVPGIASASEDQSYDESGYQATTTSYEGDTSNENRTYEHKKGGYEGYHKAGYSDKDGFDGSGYGDTRGKDKDKDSRQDKDKGTAYSDKKDDCPDEASHTKDKHKDDKKHHKTVKKEEPKVIVKKEVVHKPVVKEKVIHKPAKVRQEVSQQVNQEVNVTVEKEKVVTKERPVVVHKEKQVREVKPAAVTTTSEPQQPTPLPKKGGKGALEETGAQSSTSTAAGLGILGALGALHILTRRRKPATDLTQQ